MSTVQFIDAPVLDAAVFAALEAAGADEASARSTTRALMHASRLGVDSHGVRLVTHYAAALRGGRLNGTPTYKMTRTAAATAIVNADDGLGHGAAYAAMDLACDIAEESGAGVVSVIHSSHYGAAGAYALAAAERGLIGLSSTNADSGVMLHGGAVPFHGTNPLAVAAPVAGARPWLLDMATSSIPGNRVLLYKTLGKPVPEDVAADAAGLPTTVADAVRMLVPVGGAAFGFKGAALAGLATILSAVLSGTTLDHELIPMVGGTDMKTPRNLGHFCLAIDPARFIGRAAFEALMAHYLAGLRASPVRPGEEAMAPGDREWQVAEERAAAGIPVDFETAAFLKLTPVS